MLDIFTELRAAASRVLDRRIDWYGDASDGDVRLSGTIVQDIHARTITVPPGGGVNVSAIGDASDEPSARYPILAATERIVIRGTLYPILHTGATAPQGTEGGPGEDHALGTGTFGGPGTGGYVGAIDGPANGGESLRLRGLYDGNPAFFRKPHSVYEWLNWAYGLTTAQAGFAGNGGGSSGAAVGGAGGASAGAILLIAPIIDCEEGGAIDLHGGAGGNATSGATPDAWVASHAYQAGLPDLGSHSPFGDVVIPTSPNGHAYLCVDPGTSSGSQPAWPTDGSTVADGGVIWRDLGPTGNAGGGGGGSGGVFGALYRQWLGATPILYGGGGGAGYGSGTVGEDGPAGVRVELVDA